MSAAREDLLAVPSVAIRPMRESDLEQVQRIERESYRFPWTEGIFHDCLRVGYTCIVAEIDVDQPLAWTDGGWEWRFPVTVAPRYGLVAGWLRRARMVPQPLVEDVLSAVLRSVAARPTLADVQAKVDAKPEAVMKAIRSQRGSAAETDREGETAPQEAKP